jgi:hypothetical protein
MMMVKKRERGGERGGERGRERRREKVEKDGR